MPLLTDYAIHRTLSGIGYPVGLANPFLGIDDGLQAGLFIHQEGFRCDQSVQVLRGPIQDVMLAVQALGLGLYLRCTVDVIVVEGSGQDTLQRLKAAVHLLATTAFGELVRIPETRCAGEGGVGGGRGNGGCHAEGAGCFANVNGRSMRISKSIASVDEGVMALIRGCFPGML